MNRKLYQRIHGRCSVHGMNHMRDGRGRRIRGCVCEVAEEASSKSKHPWWKRYARRIARRSGWD